MIIVRQDETYMNRTPPATGKREIVIGGTTTRAFPAVRAVLAHAAVSALERGVLPGFEVLARVAVALRVEPWQLYAPPRSIVWAYRAAQRADRVRALYALRAAAQWPATSSAVAQLPRTCPACPLRLGVEAAAARARRRAEAEHGAEHGAERELDVGGRGVPELAEAPCDEQRDGRAEPGAGREPCPRCGRNGHHVPLGSSFL